MRIFVMILIIAIGLSGFPAAAHAFSKDSCDSSASSQLADADHEVCADHNHDQDQKEKVGHDKAAKSQCLDCVHCCTGHAFNTSTDALKLHAETNKTFPVLADRSIGDYHSSLLRPPQTLV